MSRTRMFHVTQNYTEYYTVTWEVEAESFDDAVEQVENGYAEEYDRDFNDSEYDSIEDVTCRECDEDWSLSKLQYPWVIAGVMIFSLILAILDS